MSCTKIAVCYLILTQKASHKISKQLKCIKIHEKNIILLVWQRTKNAKHRLYNTLEPIGWPEVDRMYTSKAGLLLVLFKVASPLWRGINIAHGAIVSTNQTVNLCGTVFTKLLAPKKASSVILWKQSILPSMTQSSFHLRNHLMLTLIWIHKNLSWQKCSKHKV